MLLIVLVSIVMGILPMLVYATVLWWLDRWEKEPLPLLAAAFLWGFVPAAVGALILQLLLNIPVSSAFYYNQLAYDLVSAGFIAPLTEEGLKALAVLLIFLFFYREIDSLLDGIIYGALVGFGFAAIENVLYFISQGSQDPSSLGCLIFMRAGLFGLNHAFFTSLTGLGFAAGRFQKNIFLRLLLPLVGVFCAMAAHSLHNSLVSVGIIGFPIAIGADWMGILGILTIALISLYHEAGWIRKYLAEEVVLGTLTPAQANTVASFFGRIASNFTSLGGGLGKWWNTRRFYQQCTELAYKKHQFSRMGSEGENQQVVLDKLRAQVHLLSAKV